MKFELHDIVGWIKSIHFIFVVISKSEIDNGDDTMYTITPIKNFQAPNDVIKPFLNRVVPLRELYDIADGSNYFDYD
tara:strand:- start:4062 stop:4292 length:231 start_codon:yes stop_codon:yes gene_type:complete